MKKENRKCSPKGGSQKAPSRTASQDNPGAASKNSASQKNNEHNRDISSKDVFKNPVLCAQFLRDNVNIPILKNLQPEDIEDVSDRYHPYLGTELETDSVNRIRILDIEKRTAGTIADTAAAANNADTGTTESCGDAGDTESFLTPPFLVSLIDHKSLVDYDVPMQLLRYMVCIWTEYRREMERKHKGISSRKGFRYPVILPIVYYEGKADWSAVRNLCGRIGGYSVFRESKSQESESQEAESRESESQELEYRQWIPDFRYELVSINKYSDQELLERGDEISLIMLINKMQNAADLEEFLRIPADKLDPILKDSPEHVVDVMVSVVESLCFKMDIPAEERAECVRKVRERKMGYLWENMEKFSIQEERRKTAEQKDRADAEQKRADAERQRAEEQERRAERAEAELREARELIQRLNAVSGIIEEQPSIPEL